MGLWTLAIDRHQMITLPPGAKSYTHADVKVKDAGGSFDDREVVVLEKGQELPRRAKGDKEPADPRVHMARNKNLGVIFCVTLLLVLTITNVPLRGMLSVVVIMMIILLSVIFALAGWWEWILMNLGRLDIRISAGGYIFISTVLLIIWLVALLFFDRQVYMVFTPGQFKVCTEIGGGEKVYDTMGLTLERQRGDLFRHYILGLGSGDLVVKTAGAQAHHFDLPNVLFISKKVQMIEDVIRKRKIEVGP
jgi:hypothetical protein